MTQELETTTGEPFIGKELGETNFRIDAEALDHYYGGLEVPAPAASDVAPSMLANNADLTTRAYFENDFGNPLAAPGVGAAPRRSSRTLRIKPADG